MSTPLIVMGVQGCGKSTIGRMLAERLGEPFFDGDDLHSEESKAKMGAGVPLTDTDREPWLRRIAELIASEAAARRHVIIGCSALKRSYRDLLRSTVATTRFVHLAGSFEVMTERIQGRNHEYMPTTLLASQFETLEELAGDEAGIVVSVEQTPAQIVDEVLEYLAAS